MTFTADFPLHERSELPETQPRIQLTACSAAKGLWQCNIAVHNYNDDVYAYIFIIKQNTHSDDLLVITEKEKHNRSGFLQTCNCIEAVNFLLLNYVIPVL